MNKKEKQAQSASQLDKKVKRVKTHHVSADSFLLEEAESAKLKTDQCYQEFLKTCGHLQEVFHAVFLARKLNKTEFDYKSHIMDANCLIMALKRLNRLDKHNCKRSRDAVSERKQKVEALNLQFQNLQYEVTHLQKEVTKCLEFRSQDEDIELVPVEEFYQEAPPSISRPEVTQNDNHELTLARLQWELEQRKRLATKLKQSEVSRESCKQSIRKLKEVLLGIHPTLQNIIQATEPLQSKLGMPLQEVHFKHRIARFLPKPLYILYVEACAYKEACDKMIDISVEGSVDDAKVLQLKLDDILEDSGESDQEEMPNPKRHRHSISVRLDDSHKEVLNKHPLSVCLTIDGNGEKICVEFFYLYRLSIVTAAVKSVSSKSGAIADRFLLNPSKLLNCLFPGDSGLSSPNPANKYRLKKLENEGLLFSNDETGVPYIWVQQVSGLHFLSVDTSGSEESRADNGMNDSFMESVVKAIRLRLMARVSLAQDVATLVSGSAIPGYISEMTNATNIKSKLKKWCAATWSDVMKHPSYSKLLELDIISKDAYVYQALIERGSASLTALVLILPDYPSRSPVFLLFLQHKVHGTEATSYALRELEEEINVKTVEEIRNKEEMGNCAEMLFLYQVYHLLACFDVFLETEFCADSVEGPKEFMQDTVYTKVFRGRSHSRPYRYLTSKGIYTHR